MASTSTIETHFSFQLAFIEAIARYTHPGDSLDALSRLRKHYRIPHHKGANLKVASFYIKGAKDFYMTEAKLLFYLHTRCTRDITTPLAAFLYATYAFFSLKATPISLSNPLMSRLYSAIIEIYPIPSVLEFVWKFYWLLLPSLGNQSFIIHLRASGMFLVNAVASHYCTTKDRPPPP